MDHAPDDTPHLTPFQKKLLWTSKQRGTTNGPALAKLLERSKESIHNEWNRVIDEFEVDDRLAARDKAFELGLVGDDPPPEPRRRRPRHGRA